MRKNKTGRVKFPDFRLYYKATVIKTVYGTSTKTHTDQRNKTESRNKPTHLGSIDLQQRKQEYTMEKTVSQTSDTSKIGQLYLKERNQNIHQSIYKSTLKWIKDRNIRPDTDTSFREFGALLY